MSLIHNELTSSSFIRWWRYTAVCLKNLGYVKRTSRIPCPALQARALHGCRGVGSLRCGQRVWSQQGPATATGIGGIPLTELGQVPGVTGQPRPGSSWGPERDAPLQSVHLPSPQDTSRGGAERPRGRRRCHPSPSPSPGGLGLL